MSIPQQWRDAVASKADELQMLGYTDLTAEDIWNCVAQSWGEALPPAHVIAQGIFGVHGATVVEYLARHNRHQKLSLEELVRSIIDSPGNA
ncbi:MAG: hypothetical protein IMW91_03690 [Firmicutes bacterium]|nr:hypothetical protein [Bacillota bacterium]